MNRKPQSSSKFLLTGPVQGGKSTYLFRLVEFLENNSLRVGGLLCPGSMNAGKRSGFTLKNISTGEEHVMARVQERPGWKAFGRFWFDPEVFKKGEQWISKCIEDSPDVILIDEVGPMELEGAGWSDSLEQIQESQVPVQVWSVREKLLDQVMLRWNIPSGNVLRVDEVDVSVAAEQISRPLSGNQKKEKNK